ncbi:MAG: pyridoxamine 5'-phosphate oxidase family protein [Methanomicrobiales archaeon]|nr:pyridoxamine 5'-phosphate oxidase family protein [Methanomicrobiales archaeon]
MPGAELFRQDLERLILDFIEDQQMCVLATCADDIPRASAVEFFPRGFVLYILTEGGRKIENLSKNPFISVAIHTPFTGWDSIKGIQLSGMAEIGRTGSTIFREGEAAYRQRKSAPDFSLPEFLFVIRIVPATIEYLDTTLKTRGYAVRHTLEFP